MLYKNVCSADWFKRLRLATKQLGTAAIVIIDLSVDVVRLISRESVVVGKLLSGARVRVDDSVELAERVSTGSIIVVVALYIDQTAEGKRSR